jgi:hypothetical protein
MLKITIFRVSHSPFIPPRPLQVLHLLLSLDVSQCVLIHVLVLGRLREHLLTLRVFLLLVQQWVVKVCY